MIKERSFRIAFLFSLGVHSLIFAPLSGLLPFPADRAKPPIEVTYVKIKREITPAAKPRPLIAKKVALEKTAEPPPAGPVKEKRPQPKEINAAESAKIPDIMQYVSPLAKGESEALNYLKAIRNKINLFVHENYSASMGEGEALVHFVLNNDGTVYSVSILEDNLRGDRRLKDLCVDSILLSSPFQPFPQGLDLPQAAFNITISFEKK